MTDVERIQAARIAVISAGMVLLEANARLARVVRAANSNGRDRSQRPSSRRTGGAL